jgi:hypothetical protein
MLKVATRIGAAVPSERRAASDEVEVESPPPALVQEGLRRGDDVRRVEARVAVAVGALAALGGAVLWLLNV